MTNAPRSWSWRLAVGVGAMVAVVALVIVFGGFYANRNPDYECAILQVDAQALGIDPDSLYSRGEWGWWPPGLICTFRGVDGGFVTVGPDPALLVVFIVGVVALLAALIAGVVLSIYSARHRGSATATPKGGSIE